VRHPLLVSAGFAALLAAPGCVRLAGEDCRLTAPREGGGAIGDAPRDGAVAIGDARSVRVAALAGSLRIEGRTALAEVVVRGIACAATRERLEEVALVVEKRGGEVLVEVRIPERSGLAATAGLDLTVELPLSLPVEVSDTSGSIEIHDVASLRLEDGSGDVWIERVAGDLSVVDGSGSLDLADVGGSLRVEDDSGDLEIDRVGRDVEIEDGSGAIAVADVQGSVTVDADGSGDIEISQVGADVLVRDDGSGSILATDIAGDFAVENDGSGSIRHARIGGRVTIPAD
jgi:hypothetical protein